MRNMVRGEPSNAGEPSAVVAFVYRFRTPLRVVAIGIGLVFLVVLEHPGPAAVLVIALVVVAAMPLIELLGRGATAVEPVGGS